MLCISYCDHDYLPEPCNEKSRGDVDILRPTHAQKKTRISTPCKHRIVSMLPLPIPLLLSLPQLPLMLPLLLPRLLLPMPLLPLLLIKKKAKGFVIMTVLYQL